MQIFTLTNQHRMEVRIANYGARILSLLVPDRQGRLQDVVLGFDNPQDYLRENHSNDFGAAIGRYANRLGQGRITIGGQRYQLPQNNGPHCLHGGPTGWQYQPFEVQSHSANTLVLTLLSPDGDNNFPGEVQVQVRYTLTDDNRLHIRYSATTSAPTVINMTNHSYFNLSGDGSTTVLNQLLTIEADRCAPIDPTYLPIGPLEPVGGTPFDFRTFHKVGERIDDPNGVLQYGPGYDHNWCLDGKGFRKAAEFRGKARAVEVWTDQPGLQFYAGNFIDNAWKMKDGKPMCRRGWLALETQHYPNSPNRPDFPSTILRPGEKYATKTEYRLKAL
jgi:aldose 1-epimerase